MPRNASSPHPTIFVPQMIFVWPGAHACLYRAWNGLSCPRMLPGHFAAGHRLEGGEYLMGAGFVDPGFRGQLTLCLTNMGSKDIEIHRSERIVQMILHEVRNGSDRYAGRYQDSTGAVGAKEA